MKTDVILILITKADTLLHPLFSRLPRLPSKTLNVLVVYLPYVAITIGIINTIQAVTSIFFKIIRVLLFAPELIETGVLLGSLIDLLTGLLLISSFARLKKRHLLGWQHVFGSTVIVLGINIIQNQHSLVASLLLLYVLYQIKSYYKS